MLLFGDFKLKLKIFFYDYFFEIFFSYILGHYFSDFLEGALVIIPGGSPWGILFPSLIKGLSNISSIVNLSAGFFTKILFIKSIAYGGALWLLGKVNEHLFIKS